MLFSFITQVVSKQGMVSQWKRLWSILNIPDALLRCWMERSLLSEAGSLVIKAPLQLPLTPTRPTATTPLSPLKR